MFGPGHYAVDGLGIRTAIPRFHRWLSSEEEKEKHHEQDDAEES